MIEFTSTPGEVELIDFMGGDDDIVRSARVSYANDLKSVTASERTGLINFLMRNGHMSPFEHCTMKVRVTAPIFVAREWMRHRTQSYNEHSLRYSQATPTFYIPSDTRPCVQSGKSGDYQFTEDCGLAKIAHDTIEVSTQYAWDCYQEMLLVGVAREVARMCLPVNVMTSFYATANLRNWQDFIRQRTDPQALHEIAFLARQVEDLLTLRFPVAMEAWSMYNRS